jgi:hypothetical protein
MVRIGKLTVSLFFHCLPAYFFFSMAASRCLCPSRVAFYPDGRVAREPNPIPSRIGLIDIALRMLKPSLLRSRRRLARCHVDPRVARCWPLSTVGSAIFSSKHIQ